MTKLTVQKRPEQKAPALRREGLVPGVLYGRKEENTQIAVSLKEFQKVYAEAGSSSVVWCSTWSPCGRP